MSIVRIHACVLEEQDISSDQYQYQNWQQSESLDCLKVPSCESPSGAGIEIHVSDPESLGAANR
jgi:hypothetical protein